MTFTSRFPFLVPSRTVNRLTGAVFVVALAGCGQKAAVETKAPVAATASAPAAATGDALYDLAFLDAMTRRHQQAIEMAKTAQPKLKDPELKAVAESIPVAQEAKIARMQAWREQWFAGAPVTAADARPNPPVAAPTDPSKLASMAAGAAYDALFAETMAAHHEASIQMAQDSLPQLQQKPLKRLARQIIKAQRAEVATLRAQI